MPRQFHYRYNRGLKHSGPGFSFRGRFR
jgi:hypothetical protein